MRLVRKSAVNVFCKRASPLYNLYDKTISSYNDYTQEFTHLDTSGKDDLTVEGVVQSVSKKSQALNNLGQTIVFYGARQRAVDTARRYAADLEILQDQDLEALAKDIERDVHEDHYLSDLIRKGVSYHIGYLPPAIRERIENLFRAGKISTLFCTNTLLEGVNLPADNLVITTTKIGLSGMSPVDFKNLVGRVGRIEFNLYGNVFIVVGDKLSTEQNAKDLLKTEVPQQKLSVDQAELLTKAIKSGVKYPQPLANGKLDYDSTLVFLERLASIFKWRIYEPETSGKTAKGSNQLTMLRWYTVLLTQWMEGHGLRSIMTRAPQYRQRLGTLYIKGQGEIRYDNSLQHRNIVINEILAVIENVILFSPSNYFLKFSNEYKRIHGIEQFENDWYEYVEYGTMRRETILLQRLGFTRESAIYIRTNDPDALVIYEGIPHLSPILLESPNRNVRNKRNQIQRSGGFLVAGIPVPTPWCCIG